MNLFCRLFILLLPCLICLAASITREGKIVGGYEAEPHSNPYVVSLQIRYYEKRYRHCTGSILSRRWILSAGNCVTDSRAKWYPMDAIVGAHNLERVTRSMIYPISQRIAHPRYRGGVGPYDIAMMKTSRDIEFSRKVQPIRLPISSSTSPRSENLLITGWGAIQRTYFVITIPNKLREAEVTYLPYKDCYRAIDNIKKSYEANPLRRIHNICSGIPITGSIAGCTGDSGGPLVQYVVSTSSLEVTETTTDRENTTTTTKSTMSPTPMTTDRTTTTSTTQRTSSAIPMTTDRTTTTSTTQRTSSAIPMTTDRTTTTSTTQRTSSAIPMTTDRTTTTSTTQRTSSAIPMTTDRSTTTTLSTTEEITTPSLETTETEATEVTTDAATINDMFQRLLFHRNSGVDYGNHRSVNNLRELRVDMLPTVVGVVSWGVVPCGIRGVPTVYSNVTNYMDFINEYLYSV